VNAFLLIQILSIFTCKYNKDYFKQLEDNNVEGEESEEQGKWTRITVRMDGNEKIH
jgi:uncharacterized pyridoxamine 5'-phosphate oxidase family protein